MKNSKGVASQVAGAIGLALLLGLPSSGMAQSARLSPGVYAANNSVIGVVQSVNRQLNYVTVRTTDTGRTVKIDVRRMNTRQSVNVWKLRPGDRIAASGGWENRDTFQANTVNDYTYSTPPMTSGSAMGANLVSGIVQSVNRKLNYVTVRDPQSGQIAKIDVRGIDTAHSVNVWKLRAGDRIVVDGSWENRDTFRANRVNF